MNMTSHVSFSISTLITANPKNYITVGESIIILNYMMYGPFYSNCCDKTLKKLLVSSINPIYFLHYIYIYICSI